MYFDPSLRHAFDHTPRPHDVRWVAIRNWREDPSHAFGPGKFRPTVLVRHEADRDRWVAIGATSQPTFKTTGDPRCRIPAELWEFAYPQLTMPGFVWSSRTVFVPSSDIGSLIGVAGPALRASMVGPIENLSRPSRNDFLRLRPDELDYSRSEAA